MDFRLICFGANELPILQSSSLYNIEILGFIYVDVFIKFLLLCIL